MKKITPGEQWAAIFTILLVDVKYPSGRMHLYHFEGMYTELFAELCQHPSLFDFMNYEKDLCQWNPERALKLYTEFLKREMDKACDRKQYRHVAAHLDQLKVYSGGQEAARTLADYWYVYHKNRPGFGTSICPFSMVWIRSGRCSSFGLQN